jgi:alkanesulfonate monooxygenase SsuD/methylene tetrahydromethanopterin reductase-like flavin-dependent oxidoreductase (luciferase family)
MHFGALMFLTDYSMKPLDLARALEARGFESFWTAEHSHIPASRRTPYPMGGELPKEYYDAMDPIQTAKEVATGPVRDTDGGSCGNEDAEGGHRNLPGEPA